MRRLGLVAAVVVVGAGALAAFLTASEPVRLSPDDGRVVARGATVYATYCAACHGADLEGEPDWRVRRADGTLPAPPHDETGHTWHHPDAVLFDITKHGLPDEIGGQPYVSNMPAYAGILSDDEILAVLSYIKSRWPQDVARRHDEINERHR